MMNRTECRKKAAQSEQGTSRIQNTNCG